MDPIPPRYTMFWQILLVHDNGSLRLIVQPLMCRCVLFDGLQTGESPYGKLGVLLIKRVDCLGGRGDGVQ